MKIKVRLLTQLKGCLVAVVLLAVLAGAEGVLHVQLQSSYSSLSRVYDEAEESYSTLQGDYSSLNDAFNSLQAEYDDLSIDFNSIRDSYDRKNGLGLYCLGYADGGLSVLDSLYSMNLLYHILKRFQTV